MTPGTTVRDVWRKTYDRQVADEVRFIRLAVINTVRYCFCKGVHLVSTNDLGSELRATL